MPGDALELSVIIPAFNEAFRLGPSLKKLKAFLQKNFDSYEVIIVDDGSMDRTADIVRTSAKKWKNLKSIFLRSNHGKGFATRTGVLAAKGRWILCSDADLSTPIEELESLWKRTGSCSIIIGSRSIPGSMIAKRQPLYRVFMGRIFNRMARTITGIDLADTQCGFKLYRSNVAQDLFTRLHINGFAFDVEILFIAKKLGYRICEVPVTWINDDDSRVNPMLDPARMFFDLIQLPFHHRDL